MKIRIMRGLPGSGKSYFAEIILPRLFEVDQSQVVVCSADKYFVGTDGVYRFKADKLNEAHKSCRWSFLDAVRKEYDEKDLVIVDNTHTLPTELAFYWDLGTMFTDDIQILRIVPPATMEKNDWLKQCEKMNQHGVPMKSIQSMADRLQKHKLPWYWKENMVTREDGHFVLKGQKIIV